MKITEPYLETIAFFSGLAKGLIYASDFALDAHVASADAFLLQTRSNHRKAARLHGKASDHFNQLNEGLSVLHADYERSHNSYADSIAPLH